MKGIAVRSGAMGVEFVCLPRRPALLRGAKVCIVVELA